MRERGRGEEKRQSPLKFAHGRRLPRKRLFAHALKLTGTLRLATRSPTRSDVPEETLERSFVFHWSSLPVLSLTRIQHPPALAATVQKELFYFRGGHLFFPLHLGPLGRNFAPSLEKCRSSLSVPGVVMSDIFLVVVVVV